MAISIRVLSSDDAADVARIFYDAVHCGTSGLYDARQQRAWGGAALDPDGWRRRIAGAIGYVAQENGQPIGFMTIDTSGLIDLAFVSPHAARKGVGGKLYSVVEARALSLGVSVLTTEASQAAKPFFQTKGWCVDREQTVCRCGVSLTNYRMSKRLFLLD